jgi:hypothetical protein
MINMFLFLLIIYIYITIMIYSYIHILIKIIKSHSFSNILNKLNNLIESITELILKIFFYNFRFTNINKPSIMSNISRMIH